ncbi:aldo-keto reductase family 1 member B7-like [Glandiceps talaboti]
MSASTTTLSNGAKIPLIGLGTWPGWEPVKGKTAEAVKAAIDIGYRHIDTAYVYQIESEVGEGIKAKIQDGTVKREDLFVTSKLWQKYMAPEDVKPALLNTLKDLKLHYVDLYLIHKPTPYQNIGTDAIPKNEKGEVLFNDDIDHAATWKEMEKLVDEGLVKSIGISNCNHHQVQFFLDNSRIKPVVNQFETHPYLTMTKLVEYCQSRGVHVTASSPFGSPGAPEANPPDPSLLKHPKVTALAERYKKSTGQVLLRFLTQQNISVVPKSVTPSRIKDNLTVFDFDLTDEEMKVLKSLNMNWRAHPHLWDRPCRHYPFNENYD